METETKTERDRERERQSRGEVAALWPARAQGWPHGRAFWATFRGLRVTRTSSLRRSCSAVPSRQGLLARLGPQRSSQHVSITLTPAGEPGACLRKSPFPSFMAFPQGPHSVALEEPQPIDTDASPHRQARHLHGPLRGAWTWGWACRWGRPGKGKVTVTFLGALPMLPGEEVWGLCVVACQF